MPISALPAARILMPVLQNNSVYSRILKLFAVSSNLNTVDQQSVDTLKAKEYYSDSLKLGFAKSRSKDTVVAYAFVKYEEEYRKYVYERYISRGIFPSEKITGIKTDTTDAYFQKRLGEKDLYHRDEMPKTAGNKQGMNFTIIDTMKEEYALSNTLAFNIFIHSTCTMAKYKDGLWRCVLNGYLHPKDFCLLEETCISWNRRGPFSRFATFCDYGKRNAFYNILPPDPRGSTFVNDPKLIEQVEKNREEHFLQKYEIDVRKKVLENSQGYKFFFGFMNFR